MSSSFGRVKSKKRDRDKNFILNERRKEEGKERKEGRKKERKKGRKKERKKGRKKSDRLENRWSSGKEY